jgi:hypothetical protein
MRTHDDVIKGQERRIRELEAENLRLLNALASIKLGLELGQKFREMSQSEKVIYKITGEALGSLNATSTDDSGKVKATT